MYLHETTVPPPADPERTMAPHNWADFPVYVQGHHQYNQKECSTSFADSKFIFPPKEKSSSLDLQSTKASLRSFTSVTSPPTRIRPPVIVDQDNPPLTGTSIPFTPDPGSPPPSNMKHPSPEQAWRKGQNTQTTKPECSRSPAKAFGSRAPLPKVSKELIRIAINATCLLLLTLLIPQLLSLLLGRIEDSVSNHLAASHATKRHNEYSGKAHPSTDPELESKSTLLISALNCIYEMHSYFQRITTYFCVATTAISIATTVSVLFLMSTRCLIKIYKNITLQDKIFADSLDRPIKRKDKTSNNGMVIG